MNRGPGSVFYRPIRGLGNACTDPQLTLWAMIRRHSVADWISIGQMLISMVQMSKLQRTAFQPSTLSAAGKPPFQVQRRSKDRRSCEESRPQARSPTLRGLLASDAD